MSDKPKPCPWCGWHGDRIDVQRGKTFRWMVAACPQCDVTLGEDRVIEQVPTGKPVDTPKNYAAALETWNTRASPWQPIDTAPKDGSEILVYDKSLFGICLACWHKDAGWYIDKSSQDGTGFYMNDSITHWQPLPEPPKD